MFIHYRRQPASSRSRGRCLAISTTFLAAVAAFSVASPAHAANPTTPPPAETTRQVGMAQFNGNLYVAWQADDGNGTLSIAFSTDEGQTWSPVFQPFGKGNSLSAPALAVFGGKLWMAWTGTDANSTLNLASSTNGTQFTGATQPLGRNNSPDGPALAVFGSKLYYGWRGTDSSGRLNLASSTDGVHFSAPIQPGGNTSVNAPSLAAEGGKLYMSWAGTDSNGDINLASSTDGVNFSQTHFGFGSRHQPSIAGNPGSPILQVDFTGHDDNLHFFHYTGSTNVSTGILADGIAEAPTVVVLQDGAIVHAWPVSSTGGGVDMCIFKPGSSVCQ